MNYEKSSPRSPRGLLAAARVALKANDRGYFIELKSETTHAITTYGPYPGPLSFPEAFIIVGTTLKLEN